jgi:hypothetical protein
MERFRSGRGRIMYAAKRSNKLKKERAERVSTVCGPCKRWLKIEVRWSLRVGAH